MFDDCLEKWRDVGEQTSDGSETANDMVITDDVLTANKDRTNRHLRTRDLIMEKSQCAALIVL